jgi:glucose/mannose transport system substrate-binding protein
MTMHMKTVLGLAASVASLTLVLPAAAADLEVTHMWVSSGEAAAVGVLKKAFETDTKNKWVDAAIAGSGDGAYPVITSRILGGNPMGAAQMATGKRADELIQAGLMQDISAVAAQGKWSEVIRPKTLLDSCTVDGKLYCAPVTLHSLGWMWTSGKAFNDAGLPVAQSWAELKADAPKLRQAGKIPLVVGGQNWQRSYVLYALMSGMGGPDFYLKVFKDADEATLRSDAMRKIFDEWVIARELSQGSNMLEWNLATGKIINGEAAAQVMGDWAQGEFVAAGLTAGKDYDCVVGLGDHPLLALQLNAIFFPTNKDPAIQKAQIDFAKVIVEPATQVAFASKKGSLPVLSDVNLADANACMQKGLKVVGENNIIPSTEELLKPDIEGQIFDLSAEFFTSKMTAEDAQNAFATILLSSK